MDLSTGMHREIETMKERYEAKLAVERKLAVTLKGENGLMRKRFNGLEKSIDEQKAEIRRLHEAQETLYTTIATHEKDIQAFKEVGILCHPVALVAMAAPETAPVKLSLLHRHDGHSTRSAQRRCPERSATAAWQLCSMEP